MPGLDAFQLVDIMVRLTRKDMAIPTAGDDLADFQQFVASGEGAHTAGDDGTLVVAPLLWSFGFVLLRQLLAGVLL
jgi:hypothetical protein